MCLWAVLKHFHVIPLSQQGLSCTWLGQGGSCGDKTSRKCHGKQPTLARKSTARLTPASGEWNPDHRFLGLCLDAAGSFASHSLGSTAWATVVRPDLSSTGSNTSLILQSGVKTYQPICLAPFPKTPPQQGCCLQSRARDFQLWLASVISHCTHPLKKTRLSQNRPDAELANSWQAAVVEVGNMMEHK